MKSNCFNYFYDNGIFQDKDVIIYYHLNLCNDKNIITQNKPAQYKSLDMISLLVNSGFISASDVDDSVIEHYETAIKSNKKLVDQTLLELAHDMLSYKSGKLLPEHTSQASTKPENTSYSIIEGNTLVKFDERDLINGEYTTPENVTIIGDNAFKRCYELKKLVLSRGVTHIGKCAFAICKNLESIVIPSSVTTIEVASFFACINLTKLKLPQKVTYIPIMLCFDCKNLTNVILSSQVKKIEQDAFFLCDKLENINLPQYLQEDWNNNKFKQPSRGTMPAAEEILKK